MERCRPCQNSDCDWRSGHGAWLWVPRWSLGSWPCSVRWTSGAADDAAREIPAAPSSHDDDCDDASDAAAWAIGDRGRPSSRHPRSAADGCPPVRPADAVRAANDDGAADGPPVVAPPAIAAISAADGDFDDRQSGLLWSSQVLPLDHCYWPRRGALVSELANAFRRSLRFTAGILLFYIGLFF